MYVQYYASLDTIHIGARISLIPIERLGSPQTEKLAKQEVLV